MVIRRKARGLKKETAEGQAEMVLVVEAMAREVRLGELVQTEARAEMLR